MMPTFSKSVQTMELDYNPTTDGLAFIMIAWIVLFVVYELAGSRCGNDDDSDADESNTNSDDYITEQQSSRVHFYVNEMDEYIDKHVSPDIVPWKRQRLLRAFAKTLLFLEQPLPPFRLILERLGEVLHFHPPISFDTLPRTAARASPYQQRISTDARNRLDNALQSAGFI